MVEDTSECSRLSTEKKDAEIDTVEADLLRNSVKEKLCGSDGDDLRRKMPGLDKIRRNGQNIPHPEKLTKGKLVLIVFGLFLIFCGIISFIYTPYDVMLRERLRMLPGFPPFDWWKEPPDEVLLKVYIFNVTNSREYLAGTETRLRVQEVGPFVFREKLRHTNVRFNGNGTMTYTAHRSAIFLPELSPNVSLDSRLIVPNLALLGGASFLSEYTFIVKLGFNVFIRRLNSSPFIEISANDYMWNWTDPLVGVARKVMPHLIPVENIGILDNVYRNFVDEVTVYIGPGNDRKFFLIDKFHGTPRLGWWPGEQCDSAVNSTEGVTYPQFITRNDTIRYLRKTICRVAKLYWEKDLVQESMTAYKFELPPNIFHRPEKKEDDCFTLPGDKPLPSGIADISPCYFNFPIGISLPHFYGGTKDLMNRLKIDGLHPEKSKHGSYVIIEPTTGVPMESRARSQCNLIIKNLAGFPADIHKFSHSIIPMFWLEYLLLSVTLCLLWLLRRVKKLERLTRLHEDVPDVSPLITTKGIISKQSQSGMSSPNRGQQGLPWYVSYLMYFIVVILPATQHWMSLLLIVFGTAFLYYGFSSHFLFIYTRFVYRYHKFEKISLRYFK